MPGLRILLVEDESAVADMLGIALRGDGYHVDIANNAARAQDRLNADGYELVIADWRLPDGDGLDIADTAADQGVKTILISGYLFQVPIERTARHELLMKPMRPKELLDTVRRLIG